MIEPLLNLGDDQQAINRVHRFGQKKWVCCDLARLLLILSCSCRRPTFVHRFLISDTIEEKVWSLYRQRAQQSADSGTTGFKVCVLLWPSAQQL